jgi:hypothetical protein
MTEVQIFDDIINLHGECAIDVDGNVCVSDELIEVAKAPLRARGRTKEEIMAELQTKTQCNTQMCVLEQLVGKGIINEQRAEAEKKNFKDAGPALAPEWLSDGDIIKVLQRLAHKYKDFYYFPYQMIDFDLFKTKFSQADYVKLMQAGYRRFGVIINTDRWSTSGGGIHWFAVFIDASSPQSSVSVEFFNSSGNDPLPEILRWFARIKVKIESTLFEQGRFVPVTFTKVARGQIQHDDHSCGMYSLFYIYYRLHGVPASDFGVRSASLNDDVLMKFRQVLYRPSR